MHSVKVNRSDLLAKVKENRQKHHLEALEAKANYRIEFQKRLQSFIVDLRKDKETNPPRQTEVFKDLPEPMDKTEEYDKVIKMLEMSVDTEITLTADEFDQLVMDDWSWKAMASLSNTRYFDKGKR